MKIKKFKEINERLTPEQMEAHQAWEPPFEIRVKHLIKYLEGLDPEATVSLDKDGWEYQETPEDTISNSYLFWYHGGKNDGLFSDKDGKHRLTINN